MTADPEQEHDDYRVVVNHEEQYTFMPTGEDLPPGWSEVGYKGTKAECEEYVSQMPTRAEPPPPGN